MESLSKHTPEAHKNGQSGRVVLPLVVACLLGLALLVRVGLPLWYSVAPTPAVAPWDPGAAPAAGTHKPDLVALQALALFDSALPATDPASGVPAVNTVLDLRLEGVILGSDPGASRAVIVNGNRQDSYRAGDTLPVGTNVVIASIALDHVVIDNRGQREVLWLFGDDEQVPVVAGGVPGAGIALPPGTEEHVLKTAARLAEIITVAPAHENGRVVGYRLTPGARLKDFVQLGFRTNDIVTAVNGIALDNPANLPKLYGLMDGATEVSFSLLRDGAPLSLKVTLSPETSTNI